MIWRPLITTFALVALALCLACGGEETSGPAPAPQIEQEPGVPSALQGLVEEAEETAEETQETATEVVEEAGRQAEEAMEEGEEIEEALSTTPTTAPTE